MRVQLKAALPAAGQSTRTIPVTPVRMAETCFVPIVCSDISSEVG